MRTKFIKAVDNNDIISVRLFLSGEIMLDPRGICFKKMQDYAESKLVDLYELDDNKTYSLDKNSWNKDFLNQVSNDLNSNFSRNRLDFYVKVAQFVLADKIANLNREEVKEKESKFLDDLDSQVINQKTSDKVNMYKKTMTGSVIITTVGVCLSKTVLISLGITGLVVSGYLLYKERQK